MCLFFSFLLKHRGKLMVCSGSFFFRSFYKTNYLFLLPLTCRLWFICGFAQSADMLHLHTSSFLILSSRLKVFSLAGQVYRLASGSKGKTAAGTWDVYKSFCWSVEYIIFAHKPLAKAATCTNLGQYIGDINSSHMRYWKLTQQLVTK